MRKIIFISIILIGLASKAKSQTSKVASHEDDNQYVSLLSFVGNKLFDEVKKRLNLTSDTGIKKEETSSGSTVSYLIASKNDKIKISGSFNKK